MRSAYVHDRRNRARITHTHTDMIRARVFAIPSGYEDCDDLDALRIDPAFKMPCGRRPGTGQDLMSQPTLSGLDKSPSWRAPAPTSLGVPDVSSSTAYRS